VGSGEGLAPHQPTRGLGERRKLPQRGPARSPGRQRFLVRLEFKEGRWWYSKDDILATCMLAFNFCVWLDKRPCDAVHL
jgi:hypothetical protein